MRKSKIETHQYDLNYADLVKLLDLKQNQTVVDITVSGGLSKTSGPWAVKFRVQTTESETLEIPSYTEK